MSVEMGIKNKRTGGYQIVPVATLKAFRVCWLPAAQALGLRSVPRFEDGSLTGVKVGEIPVIIDELKRLRIFVADKPGYIGMTPRIDAILEAFTKYDSTEHEFDFG